MSSNELLDQHAIRGDHGRAYCVRYQLREGQGARQTIHLAHGPYSRWAMRSRRESVMRSGAHESSSAAAIPSNKPILRSNCRASVPLRRH